MASIGDIIAIHEALGGSSGGGGGGGSSVLVVNSITDGENVSLDKTWQEIYDADFAVIRYTSDENSYSLDLIIGVGIIGDAFIISTMFEDVFSTNSASGYPVLERNT